ncbi:ATP-binding cassette subfamily B protein [Kitasatospora sp. MAP12-15]|uniref:ABC transporter ATP-binding protein n=1 Tax=unclassified Kitasatospora TaxID=2633591 RepID=UPI0024761A88|nr:ABC transporter ATP-binding protein [Kitasatospora sp. MAP12-44]MDH6111427.1 ATP-binding cassette subfamily B protein [Kitasatospora sp. MAP12-44]
MIWPRRKPRPDFQPSAGELRLFGARFGYDFGFTRHESVTADATLRRVARQIPAMLMLAWRLAWRADRRALVGVVCAEVGRAAFAAVALVATNRVLAKLLAGGSATQSLHRALVPLLVAGAATGAASWLSSASTWAAAVLEPQVERITTLTLLRHADSVELAALEDAEFARTLESARFGADSVRRLTSEAVSVLGSMLTMTATAGVILSLNVALLPMLVLIALPRAWGAVRTARRRHASVMAWLQHARASNLICQQVTATQNAAELRVHGVGRWLLECYEEMARTSERERRRLAGAAAATSAGSSAASGAASLATFVLLGWLVLSHRLPMAGAVTVIVGIRSGAATVGTLLTGVNRMFEESLYVRDLERLGTAAAERAIPVGGVDLPQRPAEIRLEKVTFTYAGRTSPSLSSVSLVIPRGKVVALVGVNGAGKSTIAKMLVGLYQPDEGRILWDDVDTRTADRRQQFDSCVLFAQDFVRWPFTIRANTTAGRPEHAEDGQALQGAADFAGLEALLGEQPNGWDTMAAKGFTGGVELSGGQWQRIGTGRAAFRFSTIGTDARPPHLVIADEPTSALDPAAEIAAFDRIRSLAEQGMAVVLITHRLAASAAADLIYVLDGGELVEQGTHDQLMANEPDPDWPGRGSYRTAYLLQARQYDNTPLPGQRRPRTADRT